jgi:hypothetical protein
VDGPPRERLVTHIGARVTFDVLLASFVMIVLLRALRGLFITWMSAGSRCPRLPGLEMLVRGARVRCETDDALLSEVVKILDLMYAAFTEEMSSSRAENGVNAAPKALRMEPGMA